MVRRLAVPCALVAIAVLACTKADPAAGCRSDAECTTTTLGAECCDACSARPITRASEASLAERCRRASRKCPSLDCADEGRTIAACVKGRCVARSEPR